MCCLSLVRLLVFPVVLLIAFVKKSLSFAFLCYIPLLVVSFVSCVFVFLVLIVLCWGLLCVCFLVCVCVYVCCLHLSSSLLYVSPPPCLLVLFVCVVVHDCWCLCVKSVVCVLLYSVGVYACLSIYCMLCLPLVVVFCSLFFVFCEFSDF